MKFLQYFDKIPQLFDWYFRLASLKRMNLNYIIIISIILAAGYYNDKRHNENNVVLINRIDSANNLRSQEQERYTVKLESYTDKFNGLLEKLIEQQKEVKQIKKDTAK